MKKINVYLIVTAILLIVLGVLCIANPGASFLSTAWIMGLIILLSGISQFIMGLTLGRMLPNAGMTTLMGLLQIIIGVMLLGNDLLASTTLIVAFAMWVMFEGISLAVNAFEYKHFHFGGWWIMLLLGICSIVLGFLALQNPDVTAPSLGMLVGLGILANGIVRIVAFFGIKRIGNRIRDFKEKVEAISID